MQNDRVTFNGQDSDYLTILLKKDALFEGEKDKKKYYENISRMLKECGKAFSARNQDKTFEILGQMEEFSSFALDVQVLKEIYSL